MADINLIKQLRQMTQAGFLDCKNALEKHNDNLDAAVKELREKGLAKAAKKAGAIAAEGAIAITAHANGGAVIAEINSQTDFAAKNENFIKYVNDIMDVLSTAEVENVEQANALKLASGETILEAGNAITGKIGEKIGLRRFTRIKLKDGRDVGVYLHNNKRYGAVVLFDGQADDQFKKQIAMHVVAMNPKFVDSSQVDQNFINTEKELLKKAALTNPKFDGKPQAMIDNIVNKQLQKKMSEVCIVDQDFDYAPGMKVGQVLNQKGLKIKSFVRYELGEGIEKKTANFADEVAQQMGK